jgi:histidine phosphotransferase ChpT
MGKDKVKLLLNLVASAITALPRGGEIEVQMAGTMENPSFLVRCKGPNARPPLHLSEFIAGEHAPPLDAMTIQAYYTWRLSSTANLRLAVLQDGADILLSAKPLT